MNEKRTLVKHNLTNKLVEREARWRDKHGTISAKQCEVWQKQKKAADLLKPSASLIRRAGQRQHSRATK